MAVFSFFFLSLFFLVSFIIGIIIIIIVPRPSNPSHHVPYFFFSLFSLLCWSMVKSAFHCRRFLKGEGKRFTFFSCFLDRKSTRLHSSHQIISYAVFCLKKKTPPSKTPTPTVTRALHLMHQPLIHHPLH